MKTFFADLYYIIFSGLDAPENTLKAAKQAKVNGAKCVHFDLNFTYDGVAVVSARS
jgi:glycerophosphoryl diester phosphodiesterase